ncbi:MAG TPA: DUF3352 domain-containing protein [Pyrinomonadaceae bacterium]|nr:DUF3352 domain-containing protein [Pyrinomonadaceae bacterium]
MKAITRPAVALLLLLFTLTAAAQQKRQTAPKPQPKPAAAPTPAPTFETLVPADCYIVYGEVRGIGQLIRSSALNDLLEPVIKLSGPPKEFRILAKWLDAHAEEVMTSRMLLATWPNNKAKDLPEALIAIEFASAEEATRFTVSLNEFLPKLLPPIPPEPPEESSPRPEATEKPKAPVPRFHLKRFGSLVVISPQPWTMKQLKPAGSKLLAEDTNFRMAHNRFNAEPLFVYVDTKTISREEEENQKRWEQQRIEAEKQAEAEAKAKKEEGKEEKEEEQEENAAADNFTLTEEVKDMSALPPELKEDAAAQDPLARVLSGFSSFFFDTSESTWPEGIAFALSYEGDSFDLRALLVNQAGTKADALPFMPMLITGPAFTPEAPGIFPADTELLATMSLDLPQIYTTMAKPRPKEKFITSRGSTQIKLDENDLEYPFAETEKQLKFNIKNDLLPLLGPEIAIRLPMNNMNVLGLPSVAPPTAEEKEKQATNGPVLAIAIKDREAMRALMPKIIEGFGMKGASALAQTERREDTELVSFANMFAYAFVGNFLVISGNAATTRYVIDSYLKHETLAADVQFRNSTRWQPKPLQGQLYISPALMEGYKTWAQQPSTRIGDQTRAFLVRASSVPQPITYSLSNEGLGPLHELHIPKNLVLMAVAGISGESNPPQNLQNERVAIAAMYSIAHAEQEYLKTKGNGTGATLEQLIEAEMVSKAMIENSGYRFELTVSGDKFEVSAVPVEYGKGGNLSLFIDQTFVLRGADRSGASATVSDPPIN